MSQNLQKQVVLEKGEFLMLQGEPSQSFFILKSGALEALFNDVAEKPSKEAVNSSGRRIAMMSEPHLSVGEMDVIKGTPRSASVRALEKSELVEVPDGAEVLLGWMKHNLPAGLLLARTVTARIRKSHDRWNSVRLLRRRLLAYEENFTILFSVFYQNPPSAPEYLRELAAKGRSLVDRMDAKAPPPISNLERNVPSYEIPPPANLPFPDMERAAFYELLLAQPDTALGWLALATPRVHPLQLLVHDCVALVARISREIHAEMTETEAVFKRVFGEKGFITAFRELEARTPADLRPALKPFLHRLLVVCKNEFEMTGELWGATFPLGKTVAGAIRSFEAMNAASAEKGNGEASLSEEAVPAEGTSTTGARLPAGTPAPGAKPGTARLAPAGRVLDLRAVLVGFELSPQDRSAAELLMTPRTEENYTHQCNAYWQLYPLFWKAAVYKEIPELIALCRYGLASPEKITLPPAFSLVSKPQGPVMFADQWLSRIYYNESPPSRDELGQLISDVLKNRKTERYRREEPDPLMDAVHFEIEQMISRACRAFSGGRGEAVTVRNTKEGIDELAAKLATPRKVAEIMIKVLQLDFTALHRDVRVQLEERSEFLPAEVIPFVLILPGGGSRAISWQEFEGRAKETPGRLVFPLFPEEDLELMMMEAIGRFRWNLAKEVAGTMWMSPAEGGLTGKYYDYINYYKKNPELSDENKTKLKETFSGVTMDVEKFVIEYTQWLRYESQGIQKLNKVARRIFMECCPFSMEVRKKLARQPAFSKLLQIDSNKRLKKRQELERRIYNLERRGIAIEKTFDIAMKVNEPIPEECF